ncbi:MAG: arsenite methyltransferase [Desulfomonile tiedjei]|uniref:Arsenite methyltransferase n=1 Tax=Desulfomonile tiedjei TaxID=2358 RepID=A0A9D6UX85_9BACT|nr:arsenite methyltransferase [Desulfomonile tiedjei]
MKNEDVKKAVREGYGKIARESGSCCVTTSSCCGSPDSAVTTGKAIGYTERELKEVPEGSNLGLGCGNPTALASLKEGETVLDLGAGAGFDCFLAANRVGKTGKVIGVDMTWDMIRKAQENARKGDYKNVEFRLGEIEKLPVAANSVDVIISNCVINLSPEKDKVFAEAFRVLKPGGRLMISDLVLLKELPDFVKNSLQAYVGCISGAEMKDKYLRMIKMAGFHEVKVIEETTFPAEAVTENETARGIIEDLKIDKKTISGFLSSVLSIKVSGIKSAGTADQLTSCQ